MLYMKDSKHAPNSMLMTLFQKIICLVIGYVIALMVVSYRGRSVLVQERVLKRRNYIWRSSLKNKQ